MNDKQAAHRNHPIRSVLREDETFRELARQIEYCDISWPQCMERGKEIRHGCHCSSDMGADIYPDNRDDWTRERIAYERDRLDSQEPQTYSFDLVVWLACVGGIGWVMFFALLWSK